MPRKLTQEEVEKRLKIIGLKLIGKYVNGSYPVEVECFCGNKYKTKLYHVFRGKSGSCGCRSRVASEEVTSRLREKGLVLLSEYVKTHDKVRIQCFCNNIFETTPHHIFTGNTSSCGCLLKKYRNTHGEERNNYTGCGDLSGTYLKNIKKNAKDRNMEMSVSKEYLWNLFLRQDGKCAISGEPIFLEKSYCKGNVQTASLDRIDSNKGYIEGNVQWVHKLVNRIKWHLSDREFLMWVDKIHDFNKEK